jgi:myo-inositol-1(or 4)-monophosphatase
MSDFLDTCERAARAGGRVLLDRQGRIQARQKGPKDVVTDADLASQQAIRDVLLGAYPDHLFLGEEDLPDHSTRNTETERELNVDQYRWIVDPLDGTINYIHNLQSFSVSVALEKAGKVLVGVVLDPVANECFSAAAGNGAFLNGERIGPSNCESIVDALIAVSFSANAERGSVEFRRFVEVVLASQSMRRLGSAALNMCYVASGRLDGYFAASVNPWDVAAGVLILREAGGVVSSLDGSRFDLARPKFACAGTAALHAQLLEILARAE